MSEAGSIVWPSPAEPIWRLSYVLADSPDAEGVVVASASYRGHLVFYKASLPSLRVQYSGPCGPYKDPLNYDDAEPTTNCPASRVCVYSYVSNGLRGLGLDSYHRIGAYRLTHRWVFWENGVVYPRLYSAGLQCPYDHRHHSYWRLDFDIDGAASDLVLEWNSHDDDVGWGRGWHSLVTETSRVKNACSRRSWAVMDTGSGRGYHILPGSNDGVADTFSNRDLFVMRYHADEDRHGQQGSATSDALAPYLNGESVDRQDAVVWYVGHLAHEAADSGQDWHRVGPDLVPFGDWS